MVFFCQNLYNIILKIVSSISKTKKLYLLLEVIELNFKDYLLLFFFLPLNYNKY